MYNEPWLHHLLCCVILIVTALFLPPLKYLCEIYARDRSTALLVGGLHTAKRALHCSRPTEFDVRQ